MHISTAELSARPLAQGLATSAASITAHRSCLSSLLCSRFCLQHANCAILCGKLAHKWHNATALLGHQHTHTYLCLHLQQGCQLALLLIKLLLLAARRQGLASCTHVLGLCRRVLGCCCALCCCWGVWQLHPDRQAACSTRQQQQGQQCVNKSEPLSCPYALLRVATTNTLFSCKHLVRHNPPGRCAPAVVGSARAFCSSPP